MTSLNVRPPYSDAELRQLYPPHVELQLVQVLMRHGERTPVNARFQNTGLHPFWPYCRSVRHLRAALLDPTTDSYTDLQWRRRLETFGANDVPITATGPRAELDDVCDMGSLTDLGHQTTYDLGARLRNLYVDRLAFLPATITDADHLYLRSTPVPRALESLQQAFTGLYPPSARAAAFPPPTILTRTAQDETLFPNDSNCRRFAALARAFAQRTADRWNTTPEMDYLNKKLAQYMPPESPRVQVDSHPRLSGIMDSINATRAHGPATRLPAPFYDPKVIEIIERIGVEEWYSGYRESTEYRTLGIGGLMGDVVARMVGSAEQSAADGDYELVQPSGSSSSPSSSNGSVPVKFGISGCHDTTLAAILTSLGAFGTDKWPPFTSHIAIELFRDSRPKDAVPPTTQTAPVVKSTNWFASLFSSASTPGTPPPGIGRTPTESLTTAERAKLDGYYVRLRYNDEPVTVPGCRAQGNHLPGDESFCTLAAFKSVVDKFTPKDWKQECRLNAKAIAFSEKVEPAGY
ncbi:acid phosphatase SPBC4.06 like protein [Verticillium longisporum]|uniref:Acid phosphatase SPBC4.06 like protein n=1 Tax=Verticillium longisporum TaxID=100787 RepID=A0A8I2Z8C5_VERLO|nr:acid phosphatase SPBC4.06 like protein [Verticillium longisporum]KAG7122597.1 acid phosphatase SPBC4.06 like protein [Verticillium longisporum]